MSFHRRESGRPPYGDLVAGGSLRSVSRALCPRAHRGHIPPGDPCGAQHFRPPLWGGQLRSMSAPSRDEGSGKPNYPIGRFPGTCRRET